MVPVTLKFPYVLRSMLRGLSFYWPLLLLFVPFGYMAGYFHKKLRHKWLLLIAPVLYVIGEVWAWLSITGVLGDWGISLVSPQSITRYLLCFSYGEVMGLLFSLLKKKETNE